MNSRKLQELIKNLRVFYKCPACGAAYHTDDILFLGRMEKHCFMQLTCHGCSLPILATVLYGEQMQTGKPKSKPKVTRSDLQPKERQRMQQLGCISSMEIADFYGFLDSSETDFSALIKPE